MSLTRKIDEVSVRAKLQSLAIRWAEAENDNIRIECDRKASEYIDSEFARMKGYPFLRIDYATFYVEAKLMEKKLRRQNIEEQAVMPTRV